MDGSSAALIPIWEKWRAQSLVWLPERGMGYFPASSAVYDEAYFDKYAGYAGAPMGKALTKARMDLVARHYQGQLLDVGIGCGQFVESRPATYGYDVNPRGVQWLQERGRWCDLYVGSVEAASFWDSLEHIPDPERALRHIRRWVFVSLPIFRDCEHVLSSKHFRKDEHYWYFSLDGFVSWMAEQGFILREANEEETALGREGIGSFAFERA